MKFTPKLFKTQYFDINKIFQIEDTALQIGNSEKLLINVNAVTKVPASVFFWQKPSISGIFTVNASYTKSGITDLKEIGKDKLCKSSLVYLFDKFKIDLEKDFYEFIFAKE